ncbi:MAG TPA: TIGR02281 family clan AA aspartic protease [Stellaceae bacterium]|nr:TIGR02281 family clan AA aspartic protease [Stellaceae bacterium]
MSDMYGPSRGAMLRRAFLWTIGLGAVAYAVPGYLKGLGLSDVFAGAPSTPQKSARPEQRISMASAPGDEPSVETFRARNNQFFVTATINGNAVHFVVDTGATYVSLTPDDARRLGFDLATLDWSIRTSTANGEAADAAVTLADLRLGDIVEYNVPALVMKTGGGLSLLGMSFLSRLKSWNIRDGVLTIAS